MQTQQNPVAAALAARGFLAEAREDRGQLTVWVGAERIVEACRFLKDERGYVRLSFITALDWFPMEPRFEVVYSLHSFEANHWMRVKCRVGGAEPELNSVAGVWRTANWYEREVYDLFGVRFRHHPDLRRILMPEGWEGHPLRKDYPLGGAP